jgi:hypothetical protein
MKRIRLCLALALVVAVSCSGGGYPFDDAIEDFGGERYERLMVNSSEATWEAVYIRSGSTNPNQDLQLGVMVSDDHPTAVEFMKWLRAWQVNNKWQLFHDDGTVEESCILAVAVVPNGERSMRMLTVCRDGVERAACIRFSEPYDQGEMATCDQDCFDQICDDGFEERRDSMIELAAQTLTKR